MKRVISSDRILPLNLSLQRLEAAAALLPHPPKVDGNLLKDSMRKLLEVDQALRKDTYVLPKRVRKLIEQLKGSGIHHQPGQFPQAKGSACLIV
jgi:hypothetical protein